VEGPAGSSRPLVFQPKALEWAAVEGEGPVGEGRRRDVSVVPEYRGARGIPWEAGRTTFQG
jgi:hypothetical protein